MTKQRLMATASLALALACGGCGTYLLDRGNDVVDLFDFGVTVSSKPYFAFLPIEYFNATPIGYSRIEGRYHGVWQRRLGSWDLKDDTWGCILWGKQTLQYGPFDPSHPRHFPPRKLAAMKAAGTPLPTEAPRYDIGLVPALSGGDLPAYPSNLSCRRNVHLGWFGISSSMHMDEIIDFVTGWFGADTMRDDAAARRASK